MGGYVWLEERLFEALGGWVPTVPEAAVKLHLDADSYHHAWHTSLWRQRLPALREFEAEEWVAPASSGWDSVVTAVAAATTTADRLVGAYRVLVPRLAAAYQHHLDQASAVRDGPIVRALELVLADERRDWQRGEALVQAVLASAAEPDRAAAWKGRLEAMLAVD